jgi:hypothetical protein
MWVAAELADGPLAHALERCVLDIGANAASRALIQLDEGRFSFG